MAVKRAPRHAVQASREQQPRSTQHSTTVSIVGSGRLGTALARALSACGYEIEALVSRTIARARRAATLSGTQAHALTSSQLARLPSSRLVLITTPDDAIAGVAASLAATFRTQQRGRVILHASGALSSEVLSDLKRAGFATGSLHPLVSISEPSHGAESLRTAFYCIEGDRAATSLARTIVCDLGAQSFSVKAQDKALYHASAVMASGHMTALFDIAAEMLARCGLSEERARHVLLPLVRSTVENLSTSAPAQALTGTFARADLSTMRRHLAAINARADRQTLAAYVLLAQRSLQLAARNGVDKNSLKAMAQALEETMKEER